MEQFYDRIIDAMGARVSGPMHLRIYLQPAMASIFGIISGLKDAKANNPVYFWALFTNSDERALMLKDGWKSVGKVFMIAMVLDMVYQFIVQRRVYPFSAVIIALFLAIIPYLIFRGLVNRIASK